MQAQTISEQQARQTAAEFYQTHEANKSFWLYKAYEAPHQALYVFNNPEETGFVIIAGDERANNPILGWSDNGPFDYDNAPCALKALLEQYASSLEDSSYGCLGMSKKKDRNTPKHNTSGKTEVTPLLTTQWSQGAPYNNLCPVNSYGDHYFTGCVITAMAQVMNYYQWPKQGRGKHTNADTGQSPRYVQTCDFSRSRYDWENMIDNYETMEYTDAQAFAVAQLMADLGCAMDASYIDLTYGTSAISEYIPAMAAKYFHYKTLLYPENTSEEDWTAEQYEEKRRMFLEQGHPLLYNVTLLDGRGSHLVVCDGYKFENGSYYYHINMGWGGQDDGYYSLPSERVFRNLSGCYTLCPSDALTAEKDGVYCDIACGEATVMCTTDATPGQNCSVAIPKTVEAGSNVYPVTSIDSLAFMYSYITSVSIPGTIRKIPARLFARHKIVDGGTLCSIDLGEGIEEIGDEAFAANLSLEHYLHLPSTIKRIGHEAFYRTGVGYVNTQAKDYIIGRNNFYVSHFDGLENAREIFPGGVNGLEGTITLQPSCSYHERALGAFKIRIPATVDYQLDTAEPYYGYDVEKGHPTLCSRDSMLYTKDLTTLLRMPLMNGLSRIPEGVTAIDRCAFGQRGNGHLILPMSLQHFDGVFRNCNHVRSVTLPFTTLPVISDETFSPAIHEYGRSVLKVPLGSKAAYEQAPVWKDFGSICEVLYIDGPLVYDLSDEYGNLSSGGWATVLGRNTAFNYDGSIVIPEIITVNGKDYTVSSVDAGAFLYDETIRSVALNSSIWGLGMGGEALVTCPGIHTVTVAEGNETFHVTDGMLVYDNWGRNVLGYCPPMRKEGSSIVPRHSVTVPSGIDEIGWHCFSDNLQSVIIAASVDEIKPTSFKRCADLTEVRCLGKVPPSYDSTYERYGHSFNDDVFNPEHGTILYVPTGCIEAYRNSYNEWYRFPDIREFDPASVTPVTIGRLPVTRSYNLQGQRVGSSYRGIVVSGGRKVLVK